MARPDTPRMSVATAASLMLASSSTVCTRVATRVRSSATTARSRGRSRSSRCGRSGTKLARSNPHCRQCAIHSASLTSLLRPGTFLRCWALTSSTVHCPSSRVYTGFQNTPVDSIATCVTPAARNQSLSSNRSAVIVPTCRISLSTRPSGWSWRPQTMMVALCTSSPATVPSSPSMWPLGSCPRRPLPVVIAPSLWGRPGDIENSGTLFRVLAATVSSPRRGPSQTAFRGAGPKRLRLLTGASRCPRTAPRGHFHRFNRAQLRHRDCVEDFCQIEARIPIPIPTSLTLRNYLRRGFLAAANPQDVGDRQGEAVG